MSSRAPTIAGMSPDLDSFLAVDTFRQAQDYLTEVLGTMSVGYAVEHRSEDTERWQAWSEQIVDPLKPIHQDPLTLAFGIQLEAEGIAHDMSAHLDFDVDRESDERVKAARETLYQTWEVGPRIAGQKLLDPNAGVIDLAQRVGHPIGSTPVTESRRGIRRGVLRESTYVMPYDMEQRAKKGVDSAVVGSRVVAVAFDVLGRSERRSTWASSLEKGIVVDPSAPVIELSDEYQALAMRLNPYAIMLDSIEKREDHRKVHLAADMIGMSPKAIVKMTQSDIGQDQIREMIQADAETELEVVRKRTALIDHLLEAITASDTFKQMASKAAVR